MRTARAHQWIGFDPPTIACASIHYAKLYDCYINIVRIKELCPKDLVSQTRWRSSCLKSLEILQIIIPNESVVRHLPYRFVVDLYNLLILLEAYWRNTLQIQRGSQSTLPNNLLSYQKIVYTFEHVDINSWSLLWVSLCV